MPATRGVFKCSHCDRVFDTNTGASVHSISAHGLPYDSGVPEVVAMGELETEDDRLANMDDDTLGFAAELIADCISQGLPYMDEAVASLLKECAGRLRGR